MILEKENKEIIERLDRLFTVTSLLATKDLTITEKIVFYDKCGLRPKEIAERIGTTQNVVNVTLSKYRKSGVKNARKRK